MIWNNAYLCALYLNQATAIFLLIAGNLAITGCLGWKWSLWPVPDWLAVQRSKAVFFLALYDSINDMKHFGAVFITPQPCHSHFCCWWLPIWPKMDVYTINDMKHFRTLYITPYPALVCFHLSKKGSLSYNLQYTKCIPCTKNIWMIFKYHDDNYEWIFIHQIFLELVPQRIFTLWILLCWTLVTIRAINMHTDISK